MKRDKGERARLLDALKDAPLLTIDDVSVCLDMPARTLRMLCAQGRGPRSFKLGRHLYVKQQDFREWVNQLPVA